MRHNQKHKDDRPWEEQLAEAIIMYAALDYQAACKDIENNRVGCYNRRGIDPFSVRWDCLQFFKSKWYSMLTTVPGEYMIKQLDANRVVRSR